MNRPKLRALLAWRRLFRWKYVLPRLAIALALVLAVRFGLDPLLRRALIAGGEAALGAKVDLESLETALFSGRVALEGFAATNPQKPMRNLVEADRLHLKLDADALLRRRFVVTRGIVSGLEFDANRATSGAFDPATETDSDSGPSMLDPLIAAGGESAAAWLEDLRVRIEEDLESRLASPRVIDELEDQWKNQYAALKARADALREKANALGRELREAKKNPLRGLAQVDALAKQLAATDAELRSVAAELNALPAQIKNDRLAIDAARKQDEQFLRNALRLAKTDGDQLNQYLLGETVHGYISQSVYWAQKIRSWAPKTKMTRPPRAHGTKVLFVDRRLPRILVKRIAIEGKARLGGEPLRITGEMTDATSEPQYHDRPLVVRLASEGAIGGKAVVTLDRRTGIPHDSVVLDCPKLKLAPRIIGKSDAMAVQVPAGEAAFAAELRLDGNALTGFVKLRQSSKLEVNLPAIRDDRVVAMLAESFAGVDRLEANIQLSGTLRRPKWKLESNLGPQLADGINAAVLRYLSDRRDRLVAKIQARVDSQLAELEAARQEAQSELLAKLGENQQIVEQVAALIGGQGPLSPTAIPQIGSSLDFGRLKR